MALIARPHASVPTDLAAPVVMPPVALAGRAPSVAIGPGLSRRGAGEDQSDCGRRHQQGRWSHVVVPFTIQAAMEAIPVKVELLSRAGVPRGNIDLKQRLEFGRYI
jgi:anti-sigma factor RsiW